MNFFKRLSFKTKLIALCLMFTAVSVTIGVVSVVGLQKVSTAVEPITKTNMPNLELGNEMYNTFREIRINLRTLGLPGISKEEEQDYVKRAKENIEKFEAAAKAYEEIPFVEGEEKVWNNVKAAWTNFKAVGGRVFELQAKGTPEAHQGMIAIFLKDCPEAARAFSEAMNPFLESHTNQAHTSVEKAEKLSAKVTLISMVVLGVGSLFGLLIGFFFATSTAKAMGSVVSELEKTAQNVSSASTQIAGSSQSLSQAATEQAASLEETAASLEEITAMIGKSSENAGLTATSSNESQNKAEQGRSAVDQMMNSMEDISQSNIEIMNQVNHSNEQMTEIVKVIQEIGDKTKVINDIVFQTKLLSFNASVEAARAGEHGKGFAVVAEEVGNLAQMSGNAAKEISEMLQSSMKKVENIVHESKTKVETLIESGKEKVESGVNTAKLCADSLNEIVANISKVSVLAQEISNASKEQSQGVGEINKAMGQLDTVTQQNAATSQETASSAEALAKEAHALNHAVSELMATIYGINKQSKTSAATTHADTKTQDHSNVLKFQNTKGTTTKISGSKVVTKKAAGDDSVPDRNHSGFQDF